MILSYLFGGFFRQTFPSLAKFIFLYTSWSFVQFVTNFVRLSIKRIVLEKSIELEQKKKKRNFRKSTTQIYSMLQLLTCNRIGLLYCFSISSGLQTELMIPLEHFICSESIKRGLETDEMNN